MIPCITLQVMIFNYNLVYQYSNHVIATGLTLHPVKGPGIRKWRLNIDDHEKILNVIQERDDPLDMR